MRRLPVGYNIGLVLVALICAACSPERSAESGTSPCGRPTKVCRLAEVLVHEIEESLGSPDPKTMFLNKDTLRVQTVIAKQREAGRIGYLAALVLTGERWKERMWYPVAVEAIARELSCPPLAIGNAERQSVIEALTTVVRDKDHPRNARVIAAGAIAEVDKHLAIHVLRQTYAMFEIEEMLLYSESHEASGPRLRDLGIVVPREITSLAQAADVVRSDPRFAYDRLDQEALLRAGNALNRELAATLHRGEMSRLKELSGRLPLAFRLGDLYGQYLQEKQADSNNQRGL